MFVSLKGGKLKRPEYEIFDLGAKIIGTKIRGRQNLNTLIKNIKIMGDICMFIF